jgi:hypothetical protein
VWTYVGGSSGILGGNQDNPVAKPGISNATIRSLQKNVVLLAKDPVALQSTGHYPGEMVPIEVQLSNWTFGGDPAWFGNEVHLSWAVSINGHHLDNGTTGIDHISVAQGTVGPIGVIGVKTPQVTEAAKVLVEVTLRVGAKTVAKNHWNLAVFPMIAAAKNCSVPVFAEADMLGAAQRVCANAVEVLSSLASQDGPFVLVQHGGLTEENAAALARAGGITLLLNPDNGWPVCNQSALGQVTVDGVRYHQPWWMDPGLTGTLLYNTSLVQSLGFAMNDRFLDYSWASAVDNGTAYTLDNLDQGTARSIHVRAIPAFYGKSSAGAELATMVSNTALVWEGQIGPATRFVVSGLNLFNVWDNSAKEAEPVAEFLFSKLVSYAVSEATTGATTTTTGATTTTLDLKLGSKPNGSFCVTGAEQACQPSTAPVGVANANFEIVTPVHLAHDAVIDALHPRLATLDSGDALIVPVIYAMSMSPARHNTSVFCSRESPSHGSSWRPQRLVAKGPATKLPAGTNATWAKLPLTAPTTLTAGAYWIGFLSSADLTCFAEAAPAPLDAYAVRLFASGPGLGPDLSWVRGTSNAAIYASTKSDDEDLQKEHKQLP